MPTLKITDNPRTYAIQYGGIDWDDIGLGASNMCIKEPTKDKLLFTIPKLKKIRLMK